ATVPAGDHYPKMSGRAVFAHAAREIARSAMVALDHNGKRPEDVDRVIAHQANLRILEAVAQRTGIPIEKFYLNVDRYGNTSAASIPIALDEAVDAGAVQPGDLVLIGALGAGFAW